MEKRFTKDARVKIKNNYGEEAFYKMAELVCNHFENRLQEFQPWPEDIFYESALVLDECKEKGEELLTKENELWKNSYGRLQTIAPNVPKPERLLLTSIVVELPIILLSLSKDYVHQYISQRLLSIVSENYADWENDLTNLARECNQLTAELTEWTEAYFDIDNEDYLSDDIEELVTSKKKTEKKVVEIDKNYMTFSLQRGTLVAHINLLYRKLIEAKWIAENTQPDSFTKLFSGKTNNCKIVWTGGDKGNLSFLFRVLIEQGKIFAEEGYSMDKIIESHFTDKNGKYLTGLANGKVGKKAKPFIKECFDIFQLGIDID